VKDIVRRLEPILDSQSNSAFILGPDYSIMYANKAAVDIFCIKTNGSDSSCYKQIHKIDQPPAECYCGHYSSDIQISRVFEPSAKMIFRCIRIPISLNGDKAASILLYKKIDTLQNMSSVSGNEMAPVVVKESKWIDSPDRSIFLNLTEKENEVLSWIKKGKPTAEISALMDISDNTVNFHIKNIFNKLGADNRAHAVSLSYKRDLEHKELVISEIHHRVMNNFTLFSSIINLKSRHLPDSDATRILRDVSRQAKGFASFHHVMMRTTDKPCVSSSLFFGKALDSLSETLGSGGESIAIKHSIEDTKLHVDIAISCMQIISELVSNAIEHAFGYVEGGVINISHRKLEREGVHTERAFRIEISDNGSGLPDDFNLASPESTGMRIVSTLVAQIGGTIEICPGESTCFAIEFRDDSSCSAE
jgi:two-component sensor histidine kinase